MEPASGADTRARILAAASPIFAEHGFDAVGVRLLASAAKVNIAAINYHFGSKDGLIVAVCEQHLRRIAELRLAELDRLEAGGRVPALEEVLAAYIRPSIRMVSESDRDNMLQARLVIGYAAKAKDSLGPVLCAAMAPSTRRFAEALTRAVPGADAATIAHAMHLTVGALIHTITANGKLAELFPGLPPDTESEQVVGRLVTFGAAGIRALAARP